MAETGVENVVLSGHMSWERRQGKHRPRLFRRVYLCGKYISQLSHMIHILPGSLNGVSSMYLLRLSFAPIIFAFFRVYYQSWIVARVFSSSYSIYIQPWQVVLIFINLWFSSSWETLVVLNRWAFCNHWEKITNFASLKWFQTSWLRGIIKKDLKRKLRPFVIVGILQVANFVTTWGH